MSALPETQHDRWQRLDAAEILKRFFMLERALVIGSAGWIPALPRLETKAELARAAWEGALAGDALRERVFELRYPSRLVEEGADAPLVRLYEAAANAPSAAAYVSALREVLLPALVAGYRGYLAASDALADGPTRRFLELAIREKEAQVERLAAAKRDEGAAPWLAALRDYLLELGEVGLAAPAQDVEIPAVLPGGRAFALEQQPPRDERYLSSSFYWPDAVDGTFPYGEGVALQVRSAISHLNEVWAVETAGAILHGLAEELGWEFVVDAARWLYDEARHMLMGKERLDAWGLDPAATPLGGYIYEACRGQDVLYRIGMLGLFETKNIGKKRDRAAAFSELHDETSARHMEFDWADETIHAEYGRRWLKRLLENRGGLEADYPDVLARCQELVDERVAQATPEEVERITAAARALIAEAERRAAS